MSSKDNTNNIKFKHSNIQYAKWKNIPNIITIARIIFSFAIIIMLTVGLFVSGAIHNFQLFNLPRYIHSDPNSYVSIHPTQLYAVDILWIASGSLFLIAILSDFIDGYIARKYNAESNFGKFWDPVADKILINGVFVMFVLYNVCFFPVLIIFIFRDYLVDALRFCLAKKQITLAANIFGKSKTFVQGIVIVIAFIMVPITKIGVMDNLNLYYVLNCLFGFAALFSIISGVIYFKDNYSRIR